MSIVTQVANAVVFELANHEFSHPFEPKMLVLPVFESAELEVLRVSVVPRTLEIDRVTRASSKYTVGIDIGIQKRISGTPEETVAKMGELVDEIADFLKSQCLQKFPAAQCLGLTVDPLYSPEHLKQKRTFTSILSVKYVMLGD
ncbi:MAG TPA: hypothetical protein DEB39_06095 [Planctomycetaceae bacterium]|nr:hypothetical protein [Planctomycetaceae bacterium]